MKANGAAEGRALDSQLGNMEAEFSGTSNASEARIHAAEQELDAIAKDTQGGHQRLTQLDTMVNDLVKASDARIKAEQDAVVNRNRELQDSMLLGQDKADAPDISSLKDEVKRLAARHDSLEQRHAQANQQVKVALANVAEAIKAV